MADIEAIAVAVLQQLHAAGPQAWQQGTCIVLPQYLDAAEIETLAMTLSLRTRTRYEITHHLGERRIWVCQKSGGRTS
jgi:hypothetical protein